MSLAVSARKTQILYQRIIGQTLGLATRAPTIRQQVNAVLNGQVVASAAASTMIQEMAREQGLSLRGSERTNPAGFVADYGRIYRMIDQATGTAVLERAIVDPILEAARDTEEVQLALIPTITGFVRYVRPEASRTGVCARCAILAGRVYRWSEGFDRHPNCKCFHLPVGDDNHDEFLVDIDALIRAGRVSGLNKHELAAYLEDNVDLQEMVNIRRKAAGLTRDGYVLRRAGRMTPAAIRMAYPDDTPEHREMRRRLYRTYGYSIRGESRDDAPEVSRETVRASGEQTKGIQDRLAEAAGGGQEPPDNVRPVPSEPDEPDEPFLPGEPVDVDNPGRQGKDYEHPDISDLKLAPPNDVDRYFHIARDTSRKNKPARVTDRELRVATWLRQLGYGVRSVSEADGSRPDALVTLRGRQFTVEFKWVAALTLYALATHLRDAKKSTRHVVIDARDSGATTAQGRAMLKRLVGSRGAHFDEIVILVAGSGAGDTIALRWKA